MNHITRRRALLGLSSTLLLPLAPRGWGAPRSPFAHGVASGEPATDSVLLWTRVSGAVGTVRGRWEVARDAEFTRPAAAGEFETHADRDHTVKVTATGLEPGQRYYYRFSAAGQRSPVGRTRTLPVGTVDALGLAVASCSNYPFGYFNAYEAIADDPQVDFVLHLGDYLYEYAAQGWGSETGARLGRLHQPAGEIVSLADYRTRHAQYKADPQSRAMHAAHPLIPIWDDHESANNPWLGGAENHQPDTEGDWAARRAASLQAYYEWMPVRDPGEGESAATLWRHFNFGDLASLVTLETRHSGRSRQIEYADHRDQLTSPEAARAFMRDVVGAPDRQLLAPAMEDFAARALAGSVNSGQSWRLIGNQIPMARTHMAPLEDADIDILRRQADRAYLERLPQMVDGGKLDLPLYLDPWDGYPAAREHFYHLAREAGAGDLLVLTGDSHSFWANRLSDASGRPAGLELGTTGITSPGDFLGFGVEGAAHYDTLLARHNPEIAWTDCRHNGYLRLRLTPGDARADFVAVSSVTSRNYRTQLLKRAEIGRRDGQLAFKNLG